MLQQVGQKTTIKQNWLASHGKVQVPEAVCSIVWKMFGCKPKYAVSMGSVYCSWWHPRSGVMWQCPENLVHSGAIWGCM